MVKVWKIFYRNVMVFFKKLDKVENLLFMMVNDFLYNGLGC